MVIIVCIDNNGLGLFYRINLIGYIIEIHIWNKSIKYYREDFILHFFDVIS